RFRLSLWGCVRSFSTDDVTAYRLLLQLPADVDARNRFASGRFSRSRQPLAGRVAVFSSRRSRDLPRASRVQLSFDERMPNPYARDMSWSRALIIAVGLLNVGPHAA